MAPWELVAREAIRELVARYAHAADRGRFEDLAALFATDGVLVLPDAREARGRDAIVDVLGGAGTDLRGTTGAGLVRHHVSSLAIDVESETAARAWSYFLVVTERGPDHWGRYADRFAGGDGKWFFVERRVRLDGFAPGSWAGARRGR